MAGKKKPTRKPPQIPTPKKEPVWVRAFLAAFSESGNVRLSCESARVDRSTVYDRRNTDPDFAAAWNAARDDAADALEEEARRRAHDGVRRLKFHQGELIMIPVAGADGQPLRDQAGNLVMTPYVEHEYSDTLLIFLLKAARPETYRDNHKVEHTGVVAHQVHVYMPANGRDAPAITKRD